MGEVKLGYDKTFKHIIDIAYERYSVFEICDDTFYKFVGDAIETFSTKNGSSEKEFSRILNNMILKYLSNSVQDIAYLTKVTLNYIKKYIKVDSSYQECFNQLNKLNSFFSIINVNVTSDFAT